MPHTPDYDTARQKAGFKWHVSVGVSACRELAGVPIRDFYLDPTACIEVYRTGRARARKLFGDQVSYAGLATPPVSYGHISCLGAGLLFPRGGEVSFRPLYSSLDDGIEALQRPVDWASAGMAPFYLEFREKLKTAFPDEVVSFSFGYEGPITTAWELRGRDFFTDIYDRPDQVHEFLRFATHSIVAYTYFVCAVHGGPKLSPDGAGMADDISSMIRPAMMPEFALPYWEQYYQGRTTGARHAHIEDLRPRQLAFLEQIGLDSYDPSVSPRLNPRIVYTQCRVPFAWRLPGFLYRDMSTRDVEDFVYQAAAEGASSVHTIAEACMCNPEDACKLKAFVSAGERAKDMLGAGVEREKIGELVSPENRDRFFGYRG
jgi:hypothetical protein